MILVSVLACAPASIDTGEAEFSFAAPEDGATVFTGDTIESTILITPHGDSASAYRIGWVANNQPEVCAGAKFDGDGLADCSVIASGNDDGKMQFYAHVMNAKMTKGRLELGPLVYVEARPTVTPPVVRVEPSAPTTVDDLHIIIDEPAICPGGEVPAHAFAWTRDGVQLGTGTATVLASETAKGEQWSGVVTASCTEDYGADNDDVRIANSLPSVAAPVVQVATGAESASCVPGTATDADDDVLATTYAWKVDGVDVVGADATLALDGAASTVQCAAVVSDGEEVTTAWSDVATVVR